MQGPSEDDRPPIEFRSKVDLWIAVAVGVSVALPFVFGIIILSSGKGAWVGLVMLAVGLGVGLLIKALGLPLRYLVSPAELVVRSGLLRWRIPLASIQAVQPTRNPLSAPALSLDRLRIDYSKSGRSAVMLISPEDKRAFMMQLHQYDPGLRISADGLQRGAHP